MNTLRVTIPDIAIVVGYFALTVGLGIWFGRKKVKDAEALFLADRDAPWPVIGASLFSANISSQQFVGQAGLAYSIGLAAGAFQLVGALCFAFLAIFFVDVYLALKLHTAPEFFERRYSRSTRLFVSAINIVMILAANITTALYAGATVLSDLLGWDSNLQFNIAVTAIAVAAGTYTILGGLRSVLWTDLLQSALLTLGGVLTFGISLAAAGGWAAVLPTYDASGQSLWSVVRSWDHNFGWLPMITGALVLGVHGHCTDHDYVQRVLAGRSVFDSKMGALFAAFLKIVALFIVAAPGVIAAKVLPGLAHPDQAYAHLVTTYVPPGMAGLVLAGLLAAILGTVAAGLSAAASMISYDFVLTINPKLTDKTRVRVGRVIMLFTLIICSILAPSIRQFEGVFSYLVQLWSLLAPPVFVCAVAGIFSHRASARGATATLFVGTALGVGTFWALKHEGSLVHVPRYLQSPLNCGFMITLVCAAVMAAFSINSSSAPPSDVHAWTRSLTVRQPMSPFQRRVYLVTTALLFCVWVLVVFMFSPWGLAGRAQ